MNISVLILTLNEERNLQRCLDAVSWCDDIVVFDSFSTDETIKIAKANGVRVIQRKFDDELTHRTASLQVGFKHPWVFNPDADEIAPADLCEEMLKVAADSSRSEVAYRMRFKNMFMGKWLKHSSLYPTWIVRLFRPEKLSFERTINLRYCVDGPEGWLQSHLLHYSFNNGIEAWFDKHNRYSHGEALETLASLDRGPVVWSKLWSRNPVERRQALKDASFRVPCRPTFRFFYMYLWSLGCLDGFEGFIFCKLMATYEFMITLKIREMRLNKAAADVRPGQQQRRNPIC